MSYYQSQNYTDHDQSSNSKIILIKKIINSSLRFDFCPAAKSKLIAKVFYLVVLNFIDKITTNR